MTLPDSYFTGGSEWADVEESIRPILEVFQGRAGFRPSPTLRRTWIVGAREWYENFGCDASLLLGAIDEMQKDGLSIKSPASCVTLATTLKMAGGRPTGIKSDAIDRWMEGKHG